MSDELARFFEIARNSQAASFEDIGAEYLDICAVDAVFANFLSDWIDPECFGAAPLVIRAHASFRAASQLVMSGQIPEAFMIIRGILECALYANHINIAPSAFEIWIQRGENAEAKKKCVTEFSARKVFGSLREKNSELGDAAGRLYERAIDFGAHPNQAAVTSSLEVSEKGQQVWYEQAYITRDLLSLKLGAKSLCQAGILCIDILAAVFPIHVKTRGIENQLSPIRQKLLLGSAV